MSLARDLGLPLGGGGGAGGAGSVNVSAGTTSNNLTNLVFSNSNGVSFGLNGSTVTASITPAGGAQTAISGIVASDATYTSGTVIFSNQANITVGTSTNGASQYVRLSVAAQSNQSAIKGWGVSNTGATAGNTGISTGIDWVIAGSNLITMSQSTVGGGPNTVWVQHPSWLTTAMASNASTQFVQANANFNGTNASGTIASNNISVSVAAQSNQSAIKGLGVSNTGQTAGNTGLSTGIDWVLAGSQSITLSQSTAGGGPNTVWFQHPAWLTTAMQSNAATISNINVSAGTTSTNASAFTFSNANGVSFGLGTGASAGVVTATVATNYQSQGAYLTTAALSGDTSKYVENWKLTGNTAGTTSSAQGTDLWLAGGNGVTLSGSSNTISISVATNYQSQGAYLTTAALSGDTSKYVQNWKLTGNTAGTTSSAQGTDLWFSGGNNITISGSSNSIVISAFNQTNQSAIKGLGASNTGNTAGNTGISTGVDWVLAGTGAVTVSESTVGGGPNTLWFSAPNAAAGNVTFSAGANSSGLGSVIFSNANGVSFGLGANSVITASVNAGGGGGVGIGITNSGNTLGTSGTVTTGNYYLIGTGGVTLSQSSSGSNGSLTISAPPITQLTGINGIVLSSAGSTISIQPAFQSSLVNPPGGFNVTQSFNGASVSAAAAFEAPWPLSVSFLRIPGLMTTNSTTIATMASANATASGALYSTWNAVLYSMGSGASSQSLMSVTSTSAGMTFQQSISITNSTQASYTLAYSNWANGNGTTLTTQYSVSNTNYSFTTNAFTNFSSNRMIDVPFAVSITPGNYWLIIGMSSSTNSAGAAGLAALTNCNVRYSNHYASSMSNLSFGLMGLSNMTSGGLLGNGSFSTAGGGTTANLPISAISSSASLAGIYFQMLQSS